VKLLLDEMFSAEIARQRRGHDVAAVQGQASLMGRLVRALDTGLAEHPGEAQPDSQRWWL
jgi:hypothetical protein